MSFTLFYVSAAQSADCGLFLTFGQPLRNGGKFVARIIGRLNFVGAVAIYHLLRRFWSGGGRLCRYL